MNENSNHFWNLLAIFWQKFFIKENDFLRFKDAWVYSSITINDGCLLVKSTECIIDAIMSSREIINSFELLEGIMKSQVGQLKFQITVIDHVCALREKLEMEQREFADFNSCE